MGNKKIVSENIFQTPKAKSRKTIFQQVMKSKDWVMLFILIAVSVVCWSWVWQAYQEPFDYDIFIEKTLSN